MHSINGRVCVCTPLTTTTTSSMSARQTLCVLQFIECRLGAFKCANSNECDQFNRSSSLFFSILYSSAHLYIYLQFIYALTHFIVYVSYNRADVSSVNFVLFLTNFSRYYSLKHSVYIYSLFFQFSVFVRACKANSINFVSHIVRLWMLSFKL